MSDRRLREAERRYAETGALEDAIRVDQEHRRAGSTSPVTKVGIKALVDLLDRRVRTVVIPWPGPGEGYQQPEESPTAVLVNILRTAGSPVVSLNYGPAKDAREAQLYIRPWGLLVELGPWVLLREEAIEQDGRVFAPRNWAHREEVAGSWLPFSPAPVVDTVRVTFDRWTAMALRDCPQGPDWERAYLARGLTADEEAPAIHPSCRRGPTGWWYSWRRLTDEEWEARSC